MWEGTHNQLWLASPIGGGTIWGEMGEARGVDWLGDPQTLFSQGKRKKKKKKSNDAASFRRKMAWDAGHVRISATPDALLPQ